MIQDIKEFILAFIIALVVLAIVLIIEMILSVSGKTPYIWAHKLKIVCVSAPLLTDALWATFNKR